MPLVTCARARRILGLGLPIVGGMVSQNLLDMVDTLMVGRLGAVPLAAVGIASFANFAVVAVLVGLGGGVQTLVARRIGEGRTAEAAIPLNGGLLTALVAGLPLAVGMVLLAPLLFPYLVDHNAAVIADGVPYWQARLAGAVAIGLNFSFRGYWNGIGETRTYLRIIVTVHVTNAILSYGLIFGSFGLPALGTLGAGLGTTLALYLGTFLYTVGTLRRGRRHGFLTRLPRGATLRMLLRLSVPSAVQTLLFASGLTLLFWIAGQVGTDALAVTNVLITLAKLAVLPSMGLGLAAMTLVSGALGRGDAAAAERWAWDTVQVACLAVVGVSLGLVLFPAPVLGFFVDDAVVVAAGVVPLRIMAVMMLLDVVATVMTSSLTGAGAARQVMQVSVATQWLFGLPFAYVLGVFMGGGVTAIWFAHTAYRMALALALTALWARGHWKTIKI